MSSSPSYIDSTMPRSTINMMKFPWCGELAPPPRIGTGQSHHGSGVVFCVAAKAVCQPILRMPPISRRLRKFHGFCAVSKGFTQTTRKAGKTRVLFKEAV